MTDAFLWLLARGASVWAACLALFIVGGVALASLRLRLAARGSARAARRRLGPPRDLPEGTVEGVHVTLGGRLEGAAGDRLALRTGDTTVLLDGPLEVLAGAREVWPGRIGRAGDATLRSLSVGDVIRVSGELREEASDDAASYRAPAKRWTLAGHPLAAACEGAPRVSGPGAPVLVAAALAGGLGFLAVFGLGGEIAMTMAEGDLAGLRNGEPRAPLTLAIAAATPFRRADALAALLLVLDARRDADMAALQERAELHRERGEAAEEAGMWIDHGDLERGARLAEQAGRDSLAAHGWYAAGEFDRAADAWERFHAGTPETPGDEAEQRFGIGVLLFANRLDRAAHEARVLAGALREHPPGNERLRAWYASRARTAACLADALDARRGAAEGWQALHAVLDGALPPACSILRVDLFDGKARTQAIEALPPLAKNEWDVPVAWIDVLATEADPSRARGASPVPDFGEATRALIVPNEGAGALALPSVDEHLAEAPEPASDPGDRARGVRLHATASAALFALLAGDTPRAQILAHRIRNALAGDPRAVGERFGARIFAHAVEVQALVGLLSGDATLDDAWTHLATEVVRPLASLRRDGNAQSVLESLSERPAPDMAEIQAWSLTGEGDGAGLSRWLARPVAQPGTFLRFGAPQPWAGRDQLARWVRWGYRPVTGFRPTEEVVHLASLAAAARTLGDPTTAGALSERARRFREAILRRETAIPLAVLERL